MLTARMSPRLAARGPLALLLIAALATVVPSAKAAGPLRPDQDSFYTYSGATPLADVPPGTVVDKRAVPLSLGTNATPVNAEQLLYRTTGQGGQPTVTVTTVITPTSRPVLHRIVGYLSFYDGLDAKCDPSYTMSGGDPGATTAQQAQEEELIMAWYASMGWIVTVPDFEGTNLDWMAGKESGYGTLDAVRATESYLNLHDTTKVGLSGYSGGAVAGDWAAELAPTYAPELNLVGVALGGVPVDYAHMFTYINGDQVNSSVMPGMLLGLARAYGLDLSKYLSDYGLNLVAQESTTCITEDFSKYPGLHYQDLMKPGYENLLGIPEIAHIFNDQIMGSAPGHPTAPIFMGVGNSDGTGDTVMRADDVEALAYEYCAQGVKVQFEEYQGASHTTAGAFFEPKTGPFLQARFAGVPIQDNCASIGPGNPLDPLPTS